jgi:hypothetical protein
MTWPRRVRHGRRGAPRRGPDLNSCADRIIHPTSVRSPSAPTPSGDGPARRTPAWRQPTTPPDLSRRDPRSRTVSAGRHQSRSRAAARAPGRRDSPPATPCPTPESPPCRPACPSSARSWTRSTHENCTPPPAQAGHVGCRAETWWTALVEDRRREPSNRRQRADTRPRREANECVGDRRDSRVHGAADPGSTAGGATNAPAPSRGHEHFP